MAPLARNRCQVAAPRHLEQHGSVGKCRPRGPQRDTRQPRGPGRLVPGQLRLGPGWLDGRGELPHHSPGRQPAAAPSRTRSAGQPRPSGRIRRTARRCGPGAPAAPGPPWRAGRARAALRAGRRPRPRAPPGRGGHRGEHRGPGPGYDGHLAPGYRQPAAVTLGRAEAGRQHHVPARSERAGQGRIDEPQVAGIRHDDHGAAARLGRQRLQRARCRPASPDLAALTTPRGDCGRLPARRGRTVRRGTGSHEPGWPGRCRALNWRRAPSARRAGRVPICWLRRAGAGWPAAARRPWCRRTGRPLPGPVRQSPGSALALADTTRSR